MQVIHGKLFNYVGPNKKDYSQTNIKMHKNIYIQKRSVNLMSLLNEVAN